jgi:hypothetical protein
VKKCRNSANAKDAVLTPFLSPVIIIIIQLTVFFFIRRRISDEQLSDIVKNFDGLRVRRLTPLATALPPGSGSAAGEPGSGTVAGSGSVAGNGNGSGSGSVNGAGSGSGGGSGSGNSSGAGSGSGSSRTGSPEEPSALGRALAARLEADPEDDAAWLVAMFAAEEFEASGPGGRPGSHDDRLACVLRTDCALFTTLLRLFKCSGCSIAPVVQMLWWSKCSGCSNAPVVQMLWLFTCSGCSNALVVQMLWMIAPPP